jgi:hypothetical protein
MRILAAIIGGWIFSAAIIGSFVSYRLAHLFAVGNVDNSAVKAMFKNCLATGALLGVLHGVIYLVYNRIKDRRSEN